MAPKNKTRKLSKRVKEMFSDQTTVWGKNPALEKFWGSLASGKKVVLIHKNGTNTHVSLPKMKSAKYQATLAEFDNNKDIVAVLSSNPSQDSYEVYLYPKAKDKTVDYVIKNYKKYFKPIVKGAKMMVPL